VPHSALVEEHTHLADGLLPWVVGLLVAAVVVAALPRVHTVPRWLPLLGAVLAVVAALGTSVQVARIGHSGAKASWADVAAQPAPAGGEG